MIQSLLPVIHPILKSNFHLDFAKIGMITRPATAVACRSR